MEATQRSIKVHLFEERKAGACVDQHDYVTHKLAQTMGSRPSRTQSEEARRKHTTRGASSSDYHVVVEKERLVDVQ